MSKFAPGDKFILKKYKNRLRLDFSLVGYSKFKTKRRNCALIFNPKNLPINESEMDFSEESLYLLKFKKKVVSNLIEKISLSEKKSIMADMIKAKPLSWNMCINNSKISQKNEKIIRKKMFGGIECQRYSFSVNLNYELSQKSENMIINEYNQYISDNSLNSSLYPNVLVQNKPSDTNENNDNCEIADRNIKAIPQNSSKTKTKEYNITIWITDKFPLKFNVIFCIKKTRTSSQFRKYLEKVKTF